MSTHPQGKNVAIPSDVKTRIMELAKTPGELPRLCIKAGVVSTYLYRLASGKGGGMVNENYLPRIEAALRGESSRPTPQRLAEMETLAAKKNGGKVKRGRKPKTKALARQGTKALEAMLVTAHANGNGNGHAQGERELLKLLDGLTLGVEITRRTVMEHFGKASH